MEPQRINPRPWCLVVLFWAIALPSSAWEVPTPDSPTAVPTSISGDHGAGADTGGGTGDGTGASDLSLTSKAPAVLPTPSKEESKPVHEGTAEFRQMVNATELRPVRALEERKALLAKSPSESPDAKLELQMIDERLRGIDASRADLSKAVSLDNPTEATDAARKSLKTLGRDNLEILRHALPTVPLKRNGVADEKLTAAALGLIDAELIRRSAIDTFVDYQAHAKTPGGPTNLSLQRAIRPLSQQDLFEFQRRFEKPVTPAEQRIRREIDARIDISLNTSPFFTTAMQNETKELDEVLSRKSRDEAIDYLKQQIAAGKTAEKEYLAESPFKNSSLISKTRGEMEALKRRLEGIEASGPAFVDGKAAEQKTIGGIIDGKKLSEAIDLLKKRETSLKQDLGEWNNNLDLATLDNVNRGQGALAATQEEIRRREQRLTLLSNEKKDLERKYDEATNYPARFERPRETKIEIRSRLEKIQNELDGKSAFSLDAVAFDPWDPNHHPKNHLPVVLHVSSFLNAPGVTPQTVRHLVENPSQGVKSVLVKSALAVKLDNKTGFGVHLHEVTKSMSDEALRALQATVAAEAGKPNSSDVEKQSIIGLAHEAKPYLDRLVQARSLSTPALLDKIDALSRKKDAPDAVELYLRVLKDRAWGDGTRPDVIALEKIASKNRELGLVKEADAMTAVIRAADDAQQSIGAIGETLRQTTPAREQTRRAEEQIRSLARGFAPYLDHLGSRVQESARDLTLANRRLAFARSEWNKAKQSGDPDRIQATHASLEASRQELLSIAEIHQRALGSYETYRRSRETEIERETRKVIQGVTAFASAPGVVGGAGQLAALVKEGEKQAVLLENHRADLTSKLAKVEAVLAISDPASAKLDQIEIERIRNELTFINRRLVKIATRQNTLEAARRAAEQREIRVNGTRAGALSPTLYSLEPGPARIDLTTAERFNELRTDSMRNLARMAPDYSQVFRKDGWSDSWNANDPYLSTALSLLDPQMEKLTTGGSDPIVRGAPVEGPTKSSAGVVFFPAETWRKPDDPRHGRIPAYAFSKQTFVEPSDPAAPLAQRLVEAYRRRQEITRGMLETKDGLPDVTGLFADVSSDAYSTWRKKNPIGKGEAETSLDRHHDGQQTRFEQLRAWAAATQTLVDSAKVAALVNAAKAGERAEQQLAWLSENDRLNSVRGKQWRKLADDGKAARAEMDKSADLQTLGVVYGPLAEALGRNRKSIGENHLSESAKIASRHGKLLEEAKIAAGVDQSQVPLFGDGSESMTEQLLAQGRTSSRSSIAASRDYKLYDDSPFLQFPDLFAATKALRDYSRKTEPNGQYERHLIEKKSKVDQTAAMLLTPLLGVKGLVLGAVINSWDTHETAVKLGASPEDAGWQATKQLVGDAVGFGAGAAGGALFKAGLSGLASGASKLFGKTVETGAGTVVLRGGPTLLNPFGTAGRLGGALYGLTASTGAAGVSGYSFGAASHLAHGALSGHVPSAKEIRQSASDGALMGVGFHLTGAAQEWARGKGAVAQKEFAPPTLKEVAAMLKTPEGRKQIWDQLRVSPEGEPLARTIENLDGGGLSRPKVAEVFEGLTKGYHEYLKRAGGYDFYGALGVAPQATNQEVLERARKISEASTERAKTGDPAAVELKTLADAAQKVFGDPKLAAQYRDRWAEAWGKPEPRGEPAPKPKPVVDKPSVETREGKPESRDTEPATIAAPPRGGPIEQARLRYESLRSRFNDGAPEVTSAEVEAARRTWETASREMTGTGSASDATAGEARAAKPPLKLTAAEETARAQLAEANRLGNEALRLESIAQRAAKDRELTQQEKLKTIEDARRAREAADAAAAQATLNPDVESLARKTAEREALERGSDPKVAADLAAERVRRERQLVESENTAREAAEKADAAQKSYDEKSWWRRLVDRSELREARTLATEAREKVVEARRALETSALAEQRVRDARLTEAQREALQRAGRDPGREARLSELTPEESRLIREPVLTPEETTASRAIERAQELSVLAERRAARAATGDSPTENARAQILARAAESAWSQARELPGYESLRAKRAARQAEASGLPDSVAALLSERARLETAAATQRRAAADLRGEIKRLQASLDGASPTQRRETNRRIDALKERASLAERAEAKATRAAEIATRVEQAIKPLDAPLTEPQRRAVAEATGRDPGRNATLGELTPREARVVAASDAAHPLAPEFRTAARPRSVSDRALAAQTTRSSPGEPPPPSNGGGRAQGAGERSKPVARRSRLEEVTGGPKDFMAPATGGGQRRRPSASDSGSGQALAEANRIDGTRSRQGVAPDVLSAIRGVASEGAGRSPASGGPSRAVTGPSAGDLKKQIATEMLAARRRQARTKQLEAMTDEGLQELARSTSEGAAEAAEILRARRQAKISGDLEKLSDEQLKSLAQTTADGSFEAKELLQKRGQAKRAQAMEKLSDEQLRDLAATTADGAPEAQALLEKRRQAKIAARLETLTDQELSDLAETTAAGALEAKALSEKRRQARLESNLQTLSDEQLTAIARSTSSAAGTAGEILRSRQIEKIKKELQAASDATLAEIAEGPRTVVVSDAEIRRAVVDDFEKKLAGLSDEKDPQSAVARAIEEMIGNLVEIHRRQNTPPPAEQTIRTMLEEAKARFLKAGTPLHQEARRQIGQTTTPLLFEEALANVKAALARAKERASLAEAKPAGSTTVAEKDRHPLAHTEPRPAGDVADDPARAIYRAKARDALDAAWEKAWNEGIDAYESTPGVDPVSRFLNRLFLHLTGEAMLAAGVRATELYHPLGLRTDAALPAATSKFRALSRALHPDANPGNRFTDEVFKSVQAAFEALRDRLNGSAESRASSRRQASVPAVEDAIAERLGYRPTDPGRAVAARRVLGEARYGELAARVSELPAQLERIHRLRTLGEKVRAASELGLSRPERRSLIEAYVFGDEFDERGARAGDGRSLSLLETFRKEHPLKQWMPWELLPLIEAQLRSLPYGASEVPGTVEEVVTNTLRTQPLYWVPPGDERGFFQAVTDWLQRQPKPVTPESFGYSDLTPFEKMVVDLYVRDEVPRYSETLTISERVLERLELAPYHRALTDGAFARIARAVPEFARQIEVGRRERPEFIARTQSEIEAYFREIGLHRFPDLYIYESLENELALMSQSTRKSSALIAQEAARIARAAMRATYGFDLETPLPQIVLLKKEALREEAAHYYREIFSSALRRLEEENSAHRPPEFLPRDRFARWWTTLLPFLRHQANFYESRPGWNDLHKRLAFQLFGIAHRRLLDTVLKLHSGTPEAQRRFREMAKATKQRREEIRAAEMDRFLGEKGALNPGDNGRLSWLFDLALSRPALTWSRRNVKEGKMDVEEFLKVVPRTLAQAPTGDEARSGRRFLGSLFASASRWLRNAVGSTEPASTRPDSREPMAVKQRKVFGSSDEIQVLSAADMTDVPAYSVRPLQGTLADIPRLFDTLPADRLGQLVPDRVPPAGEAQFELRSIGGTPVASGNYAVIPSVRGYTAVPTEVIVDGTPLSESAYTRLQTRLGESVIRIERPGKKPIPEVAITVRYYRNGEAGRSGSLPDPTGYTLSAGEIEALSLVSRDLYALGARALARGYATLVADAGRGRVVTFDDVLRTVAETGLYSFVERGAGSAREGFFGKLLPYIDGDILRIQCMGATLAALEVVRRVSGDHPELIFDPLWILERQPGSANLVTPGHSLVVVSGGRGGEHVVEVTPTNFDPRNPPGATPRRHRVVGADGRFAQYEGEAPPPLVERAVVDEIEARRARNARRREAFARIAEIRKRLETRARQTQEGGRALPTRGLPHQQAMVLAGLVEDFLANPKDARRLAERLAAAGLIREGTHSASAQDLTRAIQRRKGELEKARDRLARKIAEQRSPRRANDLAHDESLLHAALDLVNELAEGPIGGADSRWSPLESEAPEHVLSAIRDAQGPKAGEAFSRDLASSAIASRLAPFADRVTPERLVADAAAARAIQDAHTEGRIDRSDTALRDFANFSLLRRKIGLAAKGIRSALIDTFGFSKAEAKKLSYWLGLDLARGNAIGLPASDAGALPSAGPRDGRRFDDSEIARLSPRQRTKRARAIADSARERRLFQGELDELAQLVLQQPLIASDLDSPSRMKIVDQGARQAIRFANGVTYPIRERLDDGSLLVDVPIVDILFTSSPPEWFVQEWEARLRPTWWQRLRGVDPKAAYESTGFLGTFLEDGTPVVKGPGADLLAYARATARGAGVEVDSLTIPLRLTPDTRGYEPRALSSVPPGLRSAMIPAPRTRISGPALVSAPPPPILGEPFLGYRLFKKIAEGSQGTTYLAYGPKESVVVVKMTNRASEEMDAYLRVHATGHPGAVHFPWPYVVAPNAIAMDFGGSSLRSLKDANRLSPRDLDSVRAAVPNILAALKDAGIVHGDLTADNVGILPSGGVRVFDLGVAVPEGEPHIGRPPSGLASPNQEALGPASFADDEFTVTRTLENLTREITAGKFQAPLSPKELEWLSSLVGVRPRDFQDGAGFDWRAYYGAVVDRGALRFRGTSKFKNLMDRFRDAFLPGMGEAVPHGYRFPYLEEDLTRNASEVAATREAERALIRGFRAVRSIAYQRRHPDWEAVVAELKKIVPSLRAAGIEVVIDDLFSDEPNPAATPKHLMAALRTRKFSYNYQARRVTVPGDLFARGENVEELPALPESDKRRWRRLRALVWAEELGHLLQDLRARRRDGFFLNPRFLDRLNDKLGERSLVLSELSEERAEENRKPDTAKELMVTVETDVVLFLLGLVGKRNLPPDYIRHYPERVKLWNLMQGREAP